MQPALELAAAATSVTLGASGDTWISKNKSNNNFGACDIMQLDTSQGSLGNGRMLLQFDLSSLPPGATITAAHLQLTKTGGDTATHHIEAHRVTAAWQQGAGSCPGQGNTAASWNERQAGVAWTVAGGDYAAAAVDTVTIDANGVYTWNLTSLVQDWVNNPASNYGVLFGTPDTGTHLYEFASREHAVVANRPQLLVSYMGDHAENVSDDFDPTTGFAGNDGTRAWTSDWHEIGEADGASAGFTRVVTDPLCASGACLNVVSQAGAIDGIGAGREADLRGAAAATLTFDFLRRSGGLPIVDIQVSGNGGANWTTLASYHLDVNDLTYQHASFDLKPYAARDTQIRFSGSFLGGPASPDAGFYVDNVRIDFTIPNTTIAGMVWNDRDRDGGLDAGEPGLANITVNLHEGTCQAATGAPYRTTTTSNGGSYIFAALSAGNYCVQVDPATAPLDYMLTSNDSSLDVTLAAGQYDTSANFGFASITADDRLAVAAYAPCADTAWLQQLAQTYGATITAADAATCGYTLQVAPAQQAALQAAVAADPHVRYAGPDVWTRGAFIPNDPDYSDPWLVYGPRQIHAESAWDVTLGDPNMIVAVLDTGLDLSHPEFTGRVLPGYDFVNGDSDPSDDKNHGTHVAGIIAAGINNGIGIPGIAGAVKVLPVKVLNAQGAGWWSNVAQGITWAVEHGARVVNLSLNSTASSQLLSDAVAYANSKGVVMVVSAGNSGSAQPAYPAVYENVIAVGATDYDGLRAAFSNYGPNVDVMAPGDSIWSTYPGGGYKYMSGTSMAAPHAAGVAALLLSVNPNLTPAQIKDTLQATAADMDALGVDAYTGYGLINAQTAVMGVKPATYVPPTTNLTETLAVDANGNGLVDPGDTLRYRVTVANEGAQPLSNVVVNAVAPRYTSYVANATGLSGIPVRDDAAPETALPLDADGLNIGAVAPGGSTLVSFDVIVAQPPRGVYALVGQATVQTDAGSEMLEVVTPVAGTLLQAAVNKSSAQIGQTLAYTLTSDYLGRDLLSSVIVTATVPAGTRYVAGSVNAGGGESGGAVTWNLGSNAAGVPGYAAGIEAANSTVTSSISQSSDDAEEEGPEGKNLGPGGMYLISTDLEMAEDWESDVSGTQKIGLRFNNVSVPRSALITNAYIVFRAVAAESPMTNSGATNLILRGQAADNPTAFTSTAYNISNRSTTTASVTWAPAAWTTGVDYSTPNLKTVVQEIVDRPGWASGNSMVFIVTGAGSRSAEAWDNTGETGTTGANQAKLVIEYDTPSTPALGNAISAAPTLVSAGGLITVTQVLTASQGVADVAPALGISATLGTNAALVSGPTPASATVGSSGTTFVWVYQASSSGATGQISFKGAAENDSKSVGWPSALSNSVLVHPPLTFSTIVTGTPPGGGAIHTTGFIRDAGGLLPANASNTPTTGLYGSVGDRIWDDQDGDGIQDADEPGIAAVTVQLAASDGRVRTAPTDTNGLYDFSDLLAGVYTVTVDAATVPSEFELLTTGYPVLVNLHDGENYDAADVGLKALGVTVGDTFWYDADADGLQDAGEPGIGNVTLDLYLDNGDGSFNPVRDFLVDTTTSDASGAYRLSAPVAGIYFVNVTDQAGLLAGLQHTVGAQSSATPTPPITLVRGQFNRDVDFGYVRMPPADAGVIGDLVWADGNGNGVRESWEPVLIGVTVCATPVAGGTPICAASDNNGRYLLVAPAGEYRVTPSGNPAGLLPSTPSSLNVNLTAGQQQLAVDFGFAAGDVPLGGIGGIVWQDLPTNEIVDGIYAPGTEPGIPEVSVGLIRDLDGSGTWSGTEPYIATFTTVAGSYQFEGLPAGAYLVRVTDTRQVLRRFAESVSGPLGASGIDHQNKPQPYAVSLSPGGVNTTADFGYREYDVFAASDPPLPGVIGNLVWLDMDADGQYDPVRGDLPLPGVTVDLLASDGQWLAATTTGADGAYLFTELARGAYAVRVSDAFGVLAGLAPTVASPDAGQDNTSRDQPYTVTLGLNPVTYLADFGYTALASLGDGVYFDINGNGAEDAGEPGIPDVTLEVYRQGIKVANPTTDAAGRYSFTAPADAYTVTLAAEELAPDGTLYQWIPTETPPMPVVLSAGQALTSADFGLTVASSYTVTNRLNTPDPVRINREISFTIRITNTGQTPLTVLPLRDTYDTRFLSYGAGPPSKFAEPASQDTDDDGTLDWPDLTASFGRDLGPNEHFEVIVYFMASKDTTGLAGGTVNTAAVHDAFADPDGSGGPLSAVALPADAASAEVEVFLPTGVGVSDFGGVWQDGQVILTWATASEANIVGFNVLRKVGDGEFAAINSELLFAQHAGANQGDAYSFVDAALPEGMVTYALQVMRLDGSVELAGQVEVAR